MNKAQTASREAMNAPAPVIKNPRSEPTAAESARFGALPESGKGGYKNLSTAIAGGDNLRAGGYGGTPQAAAGQNAINRSFGSDVRHEATTNLQDKVKPRSLSQADAPKAKSDNGWGAATKAYKGDYGSLSSAIKARKGLTKGSDAYNKIQNNINSAYGKGPTNRPTRRVSQATERPPTATYGLDQDKARGAS